MTSHVNRSSSETLPLHYNWVMSRLFPDTHPKIEALHIELLRNVPPWRKLEMVDDLNRAVRLLTWQGLLQRYPKARPDEQFYQLARLLYGESSAERIMMRLKKPAVSADDHASTA